MANQHRRTTSIPSTRLTEPLPPLPLPRPLSIETQIPYHDDPDEDDISLNQLQTRFSRSPLSPSQPPKYEPMYDYLRSRENMRPLIQVSKIPYRDEPEPEPFVVLIQEGEQGDEPPSYNELYRQHEMEMERLGAHFDNEETPAEQTEELVKWFVAMMLICLTVAGVGTAFNWGRDG